jgi:hypothetical protein
MLLFLLFVASSLISDYPHLFHLDSVTTATWLVSFDLIILSILHRTMAYASAIHNIIDPLWLKCLYYSFQSAVNMRTSIRFQHDTALYPLPRLIS